MNLKHFTCTTMDQLAEPAQKRQIEWLWHGYLARGFLTLLTSRWKNGKTTLVAGLLQALRADGEFLGRPTLRAQCLIVSEESEQMWAARSVDTPIGAHVRLLCRPFTRRPSVEQWNELVQFAMGFRLTNELDLFVVDPLAIFFPGS